MIWYFAHIVHLSIKTIDNEYKYLLIKRKGFFFSFNWKLWRLRWACTVVWLEECVCVLIHCDVCVCGAEVSLACLPGETSYQWEPWVSLFTPETEENNSGGVTHGYTFGTAEPRRPNLSAPPDPPTHTLLTRSTAIITRRLLRECGRNGHPHVCPIHSGSHRCYGRK